MREQSTTAGESIRQSLRQSFDAALIDEFQDTDPVQFEIFLNYLPIPRNTGSI